MLAREGIHGLPLEPSREVSARLDGVAASREQPVDDLYTRLVENAPVFVPGSPLADVAGSVAFHGPWALDIRADVTRSPGPLRSLLAAPFVPRRRRGLAAPGGEPAAGLFGVSRRA